MLRYREMLKLEPPAERSEYTVTQWVQGKTKNLFSGQAPYPQFLTGWAMENVFGPGTSTSKSGGISPESLIRSVMRNVFGSGTSTDKDEGTSSNITDRVGLGTIAAGDRLSKLISKSEFILDLGRVSVQYSFHRVHPLAKKFLQDRSFQYPEIKYTPESFLNRVVTTCVLIFAAIWVVGAIWFLWLVQVKQPYESAQLALLTVFIATFGIFITFSTKASRDQAFGATAAYAAVLVVFIGSKPGSG